MNIWNVLEIEVTKDVSTIKSAYAKKIKQCKPEVDPEGFKLVREAYEKALDYASGKQVNFDLNEPCIDNKVTEGEAVPLNVDTNDSVGRVFYLLDILYKNENQAMDLLDEYKKQGLFDNLEFAENFQQTLAINLLNVIPEHIYFVCFAIHFFDWNEVIKHVKNNSFYSIALSCLIKNAQPYFFLRHLRYLSLIKHRKQAKRENQDWSECCASRILINPGYNLKYYFMTIFSPKVRKAGLNLLNLIENRFPEIIGIGLNIKAISWWRNYKFNGYFKTKTIFLTFMFVNFLVIVGSYCDTSSHVSVAEHTLPETIRDQHVLDQKIKKITHYELHDKHISSPFEIK